MQTTIGWHCFLCGATVEWLYRLETGYACQQCADKQLRKETTVQLTMNQLKRLSPEAMVEVIKVLDHLPRPAHKASWYDANGELHTLVAYAVKLEGDVFRWTENAYGTVDDTDLISAELVSTDLSEVAAQYAKQIASAIGTERFTKVTP